MKTHIIILFLLAGLPLCRSQGFVNLDFEAADVSAYGSGPAFVPITKAMPGWAGYLGGFQVQNVFYNTRSAGGAAISLHSAASSDQPIQGDYSVMLQGQFGGAGMSAAIGQTGKIPLTAYSLIFLSGSETMQASFGGQSIPLVELGRTSNYPSNYLILAGDISSFAGQTGELRFTQPSVLFSFNLPYLDDIQFSTQSIPEPSVFGLFALGSLLLGWRLRHKRQ